MFSTVVSSTPVSCCTPPIASVTDCMPPAITPSFWVVSSAVAFTFSTLEIIPVCFSSICPQLSVIALMMVCICATRSLMAMDNLPTSSPDFTRIRLVMSPLLLRMPSTSSSTCLVAYFTGPMTQIRNPSMITTTTASSTRLATATIMGTLAARCSICPCACAICSPVISSI